MKVAAIITRTHNPFDEDYWASCLRENLTSSSYGEGLETGRESAQEPRQSFTRQGLLDGYFHRYGKGLVHLGPVAKAGGLSGKNFREILGAETLEEFDIEKLIQGVDRRKRSCFSCPIGCKHYLRGKEGGELAGLALPISCGLNPVITAVNCGVKGWPEVLKFSEVCSRLGMDQISVSGLIAMAVELYERGIITNDDTGGVTLAWDSGTFHGLTQDIAHRKDLGDILANGFIEAARQIGRGAEDYAIHCKGIGGLEPRLFFSPFVLGTFTNATGHFPNTMYFKEAGEKLTACCRKMGMAEPDLARILSGPEGYNLAQLTKWVDDYSFVLECLGLCMAYTYKEFDLQVWADLYTAATGIDTDAKGLLARAARGWDIKRAFNMREGATRKDDGVPKRFLTESVQFGKATFPPLDSAYIDSLLTGYYEERGWEPQEGAVRPEKIAELTKPWKK